VDDRLWQKAGAPTMAVRITTTTRFCPIAWNDDNTLKPRIFYCLVSSEGGNFISSWATCQRCICRSANVEPDDWCRVIEAGYWVDGSKGVSGTAQVLRVLYSPNRALVAQHLTVGKNYTSLPRHRQTSRLALIRLSYF
jgi:hypothetical protein